MVSSLAESGSSPARPELNMLPHTFLTALERSGGVGGGEAGVWLAKEKERVRRGENRKRGTEGETDFLVFNSTSAAAAL